MQREIVKILDLFTDLEADLEAELEARRKQYEYYRDQLLTFPEDGGWVSLGQVVEYSRRKVKVADLGPSNYVGVDNLLPDISGRVDASFKPEAGYVNAFSEGDILLGNIRPYLKKLWLADRTGGANGDVLVLSPTKLGKTYLVPDFLFHLLATDEFFQFNTRFSRGGKMPRGDKRKILSYRIPIISKTRQREIADVLDKFDALVNDLSSGLPAEIEARRKQYEYYRDKLLTFKELQPEAA